MTAGHAADSGRTGMMEVGREEERDDGNRGDPDVRPGLVQGELLGRSRVRGGA